ncbi:aggregation promoting factor surface protein [Philodulcilactobacillus myokoensis]|uniref:aggregation-promoting factor C-terminal-like domain-containing protein n=1 Tax=Philodulcilactobacillus myokoensis TaxID=2929573 RepID=UPI00256FABBE|nr:aggregation promoting factor surface protein [Philodulcilactobacillus myokoensis]
MKTNLKKSFLILVSTMSLFTTVVGANNAIHPTNANAKTTKTHHSAYDGHYWMKFAESKLSKKQVAARRWISFHESTNRYHAQNGHCYGKFQLDLGYLHHNFTPKNQELTANKYVAHRYGTWIHAKHFWQAHHWY